MYAGQLAWGYFDHPPAVAVLIKIGMNLFPGALGIRFGHVLASTLTIAGLWYLLDRPRGKLLLLGALLVFAQPFLHVYGFIATPDGPLLLFTVLYLLAYRSFLDTPSLRNGAIWGVTMSGLLYSKYHGVLVIAFTVLPQFFWLLRRPGAWVAALGGAALYFPHLLWQFQQDYPSFRYHLKGRNDAYKFRYTSEYILNQLLIFSPLLLFFYGKALWYFRSLLLRNRLTPGTEAWEDRAFLRANYWLVFGFFFFFLYSTSKGGTEAQWTALLSIPLCVLTFRAARSHFPAWPPLLRKLALASIVLLLVARLLLVAPRTWVPFPKPFDHAPWTERLAQRAEGRPVIVQNSYRFASLYEHYAAQPAWTFTDIQYRQNQYDLWSDDAQWHHQQVLLLGQAGWNHPESQPFRTFKRDMRTAVIDSFQVMKGLKIYPAAPLPDTIRRGQDIALVLRTVAPLGLRPQAGNLPIRPMITLHFAAEEMRFWDLLPAGVLPNIPASERSVVFFNDSIKIPEDIPLGPAEVAFGMAYLGMPMIREQSSRYPVIIGK